MNLKEEDVLSIVDACFDAYASDYRDEAKKMALECIEGRKANQLEAGVDVKTAERLETGRNYLMQVPRENLTVEDALEAFGFGRNGLSY